MAVLGEVARTRDFYAELRRALDLPDWTGANLDALWDVLTDLTEPTALVWRRYATFAVARPDPGSASSPCWRSAPPRIRPSPWC